MSIKNDKATKKERLIAKIKGFNNKYFNEDQKNIAISILKKANEKEIQSYYDFIVMKRRTGFAFDYSPEIAKGRLITLKEDKQRRINVDEKINEDENKLIIGDNYNALKALLVTHKNKIDIIYIDPPYNTESAKNDGNQSSKEGISSKFIYKDKFGRGGWLNMMKSRLTLAKDLLTNEGVIFVSIDDSEQAYLKILMDEIFGELHFISTIIFDKTFQGTTLGKGFKKVHEYIHYYSKKASFQVKYEKIKNQNKYNFSDHIGKYAISNKLNSINSYLEKNKNRGYTIYYNEKINDIKIRYEYDKNSLQYSNDYDEKLIRNDYIPIRPGLRKNQKTVWNWSEERLLKDYKKEIVFKKDSNGNIFPYHKNREGKGRNPLTIQTFDTRKDGAGMLNSIFGKVLFNFAKPVSLIKWLIDRSKKKNSIILDFFAGSGTTGQSVIELNKEDEGNRKFILCTNNENDIAHNITYERLHRIIKGCGTNNEKDFKWLEKNDPYLKEKLRVINIDDGINISLDENIDEKIYDDCKNGLKLLNPKYEKKDLDLYYDLSALNPLKNQEDK